MAKATAARPFFIGSPFSIAGYDAERTFKTLEDAEKYARRRAAANGTICTILRLNPENLGRCEIIARIERSYDDKVWTDLTPAGALLV